jgi:demethylmenaquinone methyltransferase/2-methoxy-6-polyprenyl-1,4-benzoquinol methylase
MMLKRKAIWKRADREGEKRSYDPEGKTRAFNFGYEKVSENEKGKLVLRHFNGVADKYDFMNTLLSFGIHLLWKRTAIKVLRLREGNWVIDVCGGTGDLSLLAAKTVGSSGRIILYDINRAMLEKGRQKVSKSSYGGRILTAQGDAEMIPFPSNCFDAAMVGFGVRNLTHMEEGFKEMYRVLKPGGKLICLELSKPTAPFFRWLYDFYSFRIMPFLGWAIVGSRRAYTYLPESVRVFPLPDELAGILKKIGFAKVTYQKLTNGIAVVHLAKKTS